MATQTLLVANLGLRANEENVLHSICTLSSHPSRTHQFKLAQAGREADLFIVDSEDARAVETWRDLDPEQARPVVMIEPSTRPTVERARILRRPLLASRLLATMDQLASILQKRHGAPAASGAVAASSAAPARQNPVPAAAPAAKKDVAKAAPAAAPAANPGPPQAGPSHAGLPHGSPLHEPLAQFVNMRRQHSVLVVDDSPTVRKQLELTLRDRNIQTTMAAGSDQAIAEFSKAQFDLVLLDVVLPGSDGYAVCKALRKLPHGAHTPIVMLTSRSSPFDRLRGTLAGCDTYLVKPVEIDKFLAVLNKYLTAERLLTVPESVFAPMKA
jgi:two-component system, cell cycle response regulator